MVPTFLARSTDPADAAIPPRMVGELSILAIGNAQYLTSVLTDTLCHWNYHADLVEDGRYGRALAASETYDLIIIDVLLPGRDGLSICRQMRSDGVASPIVMLGSDSSNGALIAGLEAGADDYLVEPFDEAELRVRIFALLRRRLPTTSTAVDGKA